MRAGAGSDAAFVSAVLDYFHAHLQPGDYIVVEDGGSTTEC